MSGVFIAIFVILAFVSKIRDSMKQSSREATPADDDESPPKPLAESFSLQQVLAEIQKVKEQSERPQATARIGSRQSASRPSLRGMMDQALTDQRARKQHGPIEPKPQIVVRSGPLGRQSSAPLELDLVDNPVTGAGHTGDAQAVVSIDETRTLGDAPVSARQPLSIAQLRDAITWREILSLPVSLREDEAP